jgi:DNA repair exonuclease SbcCD ATPase subunit
VRLKRLRLENWRGVDSREIEFGAGVTIVEGPNEAGKTSLIEALYTLIKELDSSGKQAIKAVKPVDRDVGSTVEAEIESGDYRFVYRKTYNRDKGTRLEITAPRKEQLTGREAHERVESILAETVDVDLWEALLVDQGAAVAPADIKDSAGLSHALDEAAGAGSIGEEDTDLFDAVQAEYEKYFTLKTGKAKFDKDEKAYEQAKTDVAAAAEALQAVEADAEKHGRLKGNVLAREKSLPALEASAEDYEQQWREIDQVRNALTLKQNDYDAAVAGAARAQQSLDDRKALIEAIAESEAAIALAQDAIAPERENIEAIRRNGDSARLVLADLKEKRSLARAALNTARADTRYLRRLAELEAVKKTLAEIAAISGTIEQSAAVVAKIAIDAKGLEKIQAAENEQRVLEGQRDLAATTIRITAESDQTIGLGDEATTLAAGEQAERQLAFRTSIRLPGIATIDIEPPRTAADLESRVAEAKAAIDALFEDYGVADRDEAAARLARKQSARADLDQAKRREQELLRGRSKAELEQAAQQLATDTAGYEEARTGTEPLPVSVNAAEQAADEAQRELDAVESRITDAEGKADHLQQDLQTAEAAIRQAELDLSGQRATLDDRKTRLDQRRRDAADDALEAMLGAAQTKANEAKASLDEAREKLDALDPERIQALYDNAKDACERNRRELDRLRTELAILEDRLEQSQADGRFEALEKAERVLDEAGTKYTSIKRRADAVQRLWGTLNDHRDAARQSYVRPLKEAIERLGRIVFGNDFAIELSDAWAIESRTLNGRTLPYDALSVGAKEQLGILTRLAAAQIVSKQGGVPLIIDDALGFSDPGRLETMGAAISAAGKECQVIILTCTPGRFAHVGSAAVVGV